MKKSAKLLALLLTSQLMLGTIAQAATLPALSAPASSFLYLEANTAQNNPLKGQLSAIVKSISATTADKSTQSIMDTIGKNIENTNIGISLSYHQTDGSEIYFMSMSLPETDFQTVLSNLSDLTSKDLGQNHMVYLTGGDFYFSYKNGNLIASNREGILSDLLIQENPSSLQQNLDWQFLLSQSSPNSFLKMFLNFQKAPASILNGKTTTITNLTDFLQSEGIALEQSASGLNAVITVKPGTKLALNPEKLFFVPELYKNINAQNIIFYNESFNWRENLAGSLNLLTQLQTSAGTADLNDLQSGLQEISQAFTAATGLQLETDLAPLFQNRTALAMHAQPDQQYLPGFTLVSEVSGQEAKATTVLSAIRQKLLAALESSFDEQYDQEATYRQEMADSYKNDLTYKPDPLPAKADLEKRFFYTSTVTAGNIVYDQINFDLNASNYFYETAYKSDPKMLITLSTAVTGDGKMVVTTLKDPGTVFTSSTSLANDSEWQKNFTGERTLDMSFLNFINISNYIKNLALAAGASTTDIQPVMDFLSPLQSLGSVSNYANGYYIGKVKLNLDLSQISKMQPALSELQNLFMTARQNQGNLVQPLESLDKDMLSSFGGFSDVDANAWYARYVNYMAYLGIMNGYGTAFKPGQNITRAEFIKTLMSAYDINIGGVNALGEPPARFQDVPADAWFAPYVNEAVALSVAKGYSDNTFRPNQPINRAEAMTMLINLRSAANGTYPVLKELPFTDVRPADWFYNSVQRAFTMKYATGKTATSFAPGDNLTRAETAALISRYLDNK